MNCLLKYQKLLPINKSLNFEIYLFVIFMGSLDATAQSEPIPSLNGKQATQLQCDYEQNKDRLDAYMNARVAANKGKFLKRSATDNFDLIIYVDTSYERRRTGGYSNNDSVVTYLNGVVDGVQTMFNSAAGHWDIIVNVSYQFFDAATPFSYGSNTSETLINFYDWLVQQGFPGDADNYVFYTGQYTNQGVSFVGALCFPGGALVGFVQSQIPNEDLASHEWIGHSCGSGHYNSEVNIMNSVASRPWLQASIDVIEDFLDNQSCVENVQGMTAISIANFQLRLENNFVRLDWECNPEDAVIYIERFSNHHDFTRIPVKSDINYFASFTYSERLPEKRDYYYRIVLESTLGEVVSSSYKLAKYTVERSFFIKNGFVKNPERESIVIYNILGAIVGGFDVAEFDLTQIKEKGILILSNGAHHLLYHSLE